jgi:glutamyl-tRNA synthetase
MGQLFDLKNVGRSAARFDYLKLANVNGFYMRQTPDEELLAAIEALAPHLPEAARLVASFGEGGRARLLALMSGLKERAKTLVELIDGAEFLFAARPLVLDDKARALLADGGRERLPGLLAALAGAPAFDAATTEAAVRAESERTGLKLGQLAQPLRAALTGRATSPGIFDVLAVLGRQESLARLADQA